jgi:hypothetical protein
MKGVIMATDTMNVVNMVLGIGSKHATKSAEVQSKVNETGHSSGPILRTNSPLMHALQLARENNENAARIYMKLVQLRTNLQATLNGAVSGQCGSNQDAVHGLPDNLHGQLSLNAELMAAISTEIDDLTQLVMS